MGRGRHDMQLEPHRFNNSMKNRCPVCRAVPGQTCRRKTVAGIVVLRNLPHVERNHQAYPGLHRSQGETVR